MDHSVGILLADGSSLATALALATPETRWFVMDEAVRILPALREQIDLGAEVVVCATDAAEQKVDPPPGVQLGSQHDHASLVRTAGRVIALCGARIDDHTPKRAERTVVVRITRPEKLAQALRTAVGYAGGDLRVAVLVEPAAQAALGRPAPIVARALAALRGLDHPIVSVGAAEYPARLRWDVEATW
jgi:hypothetical protein